MKINPYTIVIVILLLIIAGFTYNQWGEKILPGSVEQPKELGSDFEIFEDDIAIGNDDAPVTIIEYYSYLCGYCRMFHEETYPKILEDYITTGKVKYIFRIYPPYEMGTAVLCANDQDKFFEYHDVLFEHAGDIEKVDDLKGLAKDVGLDETEFNQCFDSQEYLDRAKQWYQQGNDDFERAGIAAERRGTPSFVINGEMVVGAQSYDKFVEVIERKLTE